MNPDFKSICDFVTELEKLKSVERKIKPAGMQRYENSAEHSWQIALLAMSLLPYSDQSVDGLTVVSMLLLHDIVEIDTGDKFAYASDHDDYENELKAAQRIFALLPNAIGQQYLRLWIEFEQAQTAEAKFAKAIDRLMPVLQNLNNGGQSWRAHDVSVAQILEKNAGVAFASPELWQWVSKQVIEMVEKIGLRRD